MVLASVALIKKGLLIKLPAPSSILIFSVLQRSPTTRASIQ